MAGPLVSDAPASPAPVDVRPNVLALPSPTVARFVLLLGALLSSGLFVGTWVHNQTAVGDDWLARVAECERQRPTLPSGAGAEEILAAQQSVLQCVEGAQQRLAWFALGGVALTLVAAGVVLAIVPRVIVRRRALRLAGPKLAAASERVAALAKEGGLRRSPDTMVGTSKLHDAFSFGLPGHYAVALPPAVAVRSTGVAFESLVRHELAHVARRDVLIAWSARALWYVLLALLALPVIVALARADVSLLPSYAWRAALLLGAAMLASAGILRSREFDADLGSTGTAARREALSSLLGTSGRAATTGWRRLLALHPDPSDRVLTLGDPARLARPSAVDAAIAGFLAAVTLPLLVSVFATVPSLTNWAYAVPAALVGPLMGVTVGLALWRRAMVDKAVSAAELPAAARRVAVGVFAGFLVGQTASLAAVGSETITGTRSPLLPLLGALALGGSTFVVAGLGGIAGDRSRRLSARGFTALAVVLSAIVFAFVLWAATMLASTLDLGGWALAALTIVTLLTQPAAVAVVAVLAAAVLVLLAVRPDNVPPVWAVEGDVSGTPAAGRRSVGLREVTAVGLASGIVAAALGFVAINAGFGGDVTLDFVGGVVGPGLPVGLLLFVLASLLSALPIPDARGRRPLVILIVVAGLLGGAAAAGAIAARDTISPLQPSAPTGLSTHDYVSSYAPTVVAGVARVDQAAAAIDADSQLTPSERARRIRTDLVAPLDVLLRQAGAVTPGDDSVVQLHAALVAGLQGNRRAFENFARAYETSDSALFSRTQADRVGAQQLLRAWLDGVRARQTR
jgi:Zn-dependent protease with chaperone function